MKAKVKRRPAAALAVRPDIAASAEAALAAAALQPGKGRSLGRPHDAITAAEMNEHLRSLPRVTLEDLERGTA